MYKNCRILLSTTALAAFAGACASGNDAAIYRTGAIGSDGAVSTIAIDAKQRMVFAGPARSDDPDQREIICAEPSPDAMAGIGSSFALSSAGLGGLFTGGASAVDKTTLSGGMAEAFREINRSLTVQLLRDGLYRSCEAYMNGAMDRAEYTSLVNRYSDAAVSLLAIEGLTRTAQVQAGAVGGAIAAGAGGEGIAGSVAASRVDDSSGGAGVTELPAPTDAVAAAVEGIVARYYDNNRNQIWAINRRKCMNFFERPNIASASAGESEDDYQRRKGLLLMMCAETPPHTQGETPASGPLDAIMRDPLMVSMLKAALMTELAKQAGERLAPTDQQAIRDLVLQAVRADVEKALAAR